MEYRGQKCDGAGYSPAECSAVCKERDELKAELQNVIAELHEVKSDRDAMLLVLKNWGECEHCKHTEAEYPNFEVCVEGVACATCEWTKIPCCTCVGGSNWEWKGIKKEDQA